MGETKKDIDIVSIHTSTDNVFAYVVTVMKLMSHKQDTVENTSTSSNHRNHSQTD